MKSFAPRKDVLPASQVELWPHLTPLWRMGFVLYGGTAVALRLGHRRSVDFDFFATGNLDKEAIREALALPGSSEVIQDEPNVLSLLSPGAVKISFFGGLTMGRFGCPELTDDGVVAAASMDDLMATKLKVILQRLEAKDYADIAAMIRAGVSLEKGLAIAGKMFAPGFATIPALKALTFFEGGDLGALSRDVRETLIDAAARVIELPEATRVSPDLAAWDWMA